MSDINLALKIRKSHFKLLDKSGKQGVVDSCEFSDPDEIVAAKKTFKNLKHYEQELEYIKLVRHTCISIGTLVFETDFTKRRCNIFLSKSNVESVFEIVLSFACNLGAFVRFGVESFVHCCSFCI